MEIIKIPNSKEVKEFANKYPFAVKEIKNNIIDLIKFDEFIISNEWKSLNDAERFEFLETLLMLNITDNILQNSVISIENNQKFSRWNYGDYESVIKNFLDRKPIDINEFANEYPFLINKVENDILILKKYETIINSDSWQDLSYKKQYELLNKILSKLIDEDIKKRNEKNNKLIEKDLKYNLPEIIVNCNYVSDKWNILFDKYFWFNKFTLDEDKPETKAEQIDYFGNEYYKLLKENTPETKGFINEVLDILIELGADEKIKFVESRFGKENIIKNNLCILHYSDYKTLHPELVMKKDLSNFCVLCFSDMVKLKNLTFEQLPEKCKLKDEVLKHNQNFYDKYNVLKDSNSDEKMIEYCNERINKANDTIISLLNSDSKKIDYDRFQFNRNKMYLHWKEGLRFHNERLNELQASSIETPQPEQKEIKNTDIVKSILKKYNFFELKKVNSLSNENQKKLLDFINGNDLPYKIAMFNYLDFIKYLFKEHFQTKAELYKEVAKWFEVSERQIKGNILVLDDYSKEDRKRYTAHEYKQNVTNNYQQLK